MDNKVLKNVNGVSSPMKKVGDFIDDVEPKKSGSATFIFGGVCAVALLALKIIASNK